MKLNKDHIGDAFDNRGSDGSWHYILLDVKGDKLLFLSQPGDRFEIDTNKYHDWQRYVPRLPKYPSHEEVKGAWKTARVSPYVV